MYDCRRDDPAMPKVIIDYAKLAEFIQSLRGMKIPPEKESEGQAFSWNGDPSQLANCYFALVAICHQTSPMGERRLEGWIQGRRRVGWDYLKEKYLLAAGDDRVWSSPRGWRSLTALRLAELYRDEREGLTLNRVSERASLLNEIGERFCQEESSGVEAAFNRCGRQLGGTGGFLEFLRSLEAYSDPVMKKSQFFLSIAVDECGWRVADPERLVPVVDYHELRGHLRIGTVRVVDHHLAEKIRLGIVVTDEEDVELRSRVQEVIEAAAEEGGTTPAALHYLVWNVIRNCCPRDPSRTHCSACPPECGLPPRYKAMEAYKGRCLFSSVCESANQPEKMADPPYRGHYY
jgi:hypothetical protein